MEHTLSNRRLGRACIALRVRGNETRRQILDEVCLALVAIFLVGTVVVNELLRCCRLTIAGAAVMLSVRRDRSALRYLALMSRSELKQSLSFTVSRRQIRDLPK
jgi:hypothetical protein